MSVEFKYLIPYKEVALIQAQIKPFVRLTSLAATNPTGQMTVRSIYFDTPNFNHYMRKREELNTRKNVILKTYDTDENKVFLETSRQNEELSMKSKATVPFDRVKKMFTGEIFSNEFLWSIKKKEAASRFFFQIYRYNLRPVLKIVSDRIPYKSALLDKKNDFKMMIQHNIRCSAFPTIDSLFEENNLKLVRPDIALLTVRYDRACPAWIKPILSDLNFTKGRLSKYRLCVEALPEIHTDSLVQGLSRGRFFNENTKNTEGGKIDLLESFRPIIPNYKLNSIEI
jgi:hypothetical protein